MAPLRAADFYWDTDTSITGNNIDGTNLGGAGNWDLLTSNWWDLTNLVPWPNTTPNNADRAFFTYAYSPGLPTYNTVTLSSGIIANQLRFLRSGYTLTGGDLTLDGTTPTLFAGMGLFATIDSQILGTSGLTMTGGGWIRLGNNTNSYTGATTLANGALVITNQSALGADSSAIVVTGIPTFPGSTQLHSVGGGTLVLDGTGGNITITRDLSLQGQGATSRQGAALISTGVNTLSGTVDMGVASNGTYQNTRMVAADGTLNLTGTLNVLGTAGTTINSLGGVNQAGASFYNVTGVLAGTGTLETSGGGTMFLNPSDSSGFSGVVRVSGSAASGQSVLRIDSPNVLGTRTATGTTSVLDMYGGVLAVLMDSPSVQSGGVNAHVYGRDGSTFFADHTPNSSVKDQTVTFGSFTFEDNETFTFNSRNGYGMSFTTASVNGGNEYTTFNNNLQGGALLSFTGNFWSNTDNGASRTFSIGGNGNTRINGNVNASSTTYNHNLTKTGTGTLTLTGTGSTLDGNVNVNGGTVAINDWRAINMHAAGATNTGQINIGTSTTSATLSIVGNNVSLANLTTNKTINLAGTTGGATLLANQTGTSPGVVLNGNFTATGAGAKTLTLGGTNTAANTINGAIVNSTSNTAVTKIDTGTWVLAGTNTYTGATTISNGILKIQANAPASTVIADTSAITFNAVNVYAGGTLEFVGQPSVNNVENLGALTPTQGSNTVKLTPGSGGTASLVFASLGTVGDGSGVNIVGSDASNTVTVTGLATGLASPRIYFAGSDFARSNGGVLVAPVYDTDATFVNAPAGAALPAGQSNFSVNGNITAQSTQIVSTLKFNGSQTLTLIPGATLTVRTGANNTDGGILATGGASVITGGTSVQTGGSGTLTIRVDGGADSLRLETPINAGTGGLTKNGAGTLFFAGANAQTGTISINEGTIRLAGSGQLGGAAALTIRQGAVLELNGVTPANVTNAYNSNGTVRNTSATTAVTFSVGGADGTGTSYGIVEDGGLASLSLVKIGAGAQSWLGLSTYTGTTTIGGTGIVSINNLVNGSSPSGIGASSSAASNLIFNGASATQAYGGLSYTGPTNDETDRLFTFDGGANGGVRIQSNGVNGATSTWTNTGALAFGPNATNNPQGLVLGGGSTGDNRFFPVINDNPAGLGAATSVYKADAGLWHLEATNTYTGATTIRGGALAANDGSSLPTASNLVLDEGSLATTGAFNRTIGTGSGQMQWTAHGSGGFSAGGSSLTVNFGNGNVWGSTAGFLGTGALLLNNSGVAKSDVDVVSDFQITQGAASAFNATTTAGSATVNLTSGSTVGLAIGQTITGNANIPAGYTIATIASATQFTLNSGTGVTAGTGVATSTLAGGYRQINVGDFTSVGADFATLSGVISGAGNLAKEGAGILNLRGANTYTGQTLVRQGTLVVETLGNSASPGATSVGDSTLGNTDAGAIVLGNGGTTAGILEYVGLGETSDRKIRLNTTTGNTQIHADGVGPLILTNVANDMVAGNKLLYLRGVNAAGNMVTSQLSDNASGTNTLGVVVDGSATWILTNPLNNYTGNTTAGGGALGIGDNSALGAGTLSMTGGNVFAYGADRTVANAVSQGNNSTIGFVGDYSLTFSSALTLGASANNMTFVNSIVAGKTLSFAGAAANSMTANRFWTIDGSGTTIINGDITTTTAFGLNLTKTGDGTLVLNGNTAPNFNQNNAAIDIDRGTLQFGASGVIPDGAGFGNLTFSPELANSDTATLDLNGQTETINGLTANTDGTAVIDNTSASAAQLVFGANDQPVSFGGGVGTYTITDSGAGALSIKKVGTADATIPTGVTLTYQGATEVDGGSTFTIASPLNGTTSLIVGSTGTNKLRLTGGITAPTAITSITVEDGGTLSLLDGAGNKLSNLGSLQLGSTGGAMSSLNLNVGDTGAPGDENNTDLLTLLTGGTLSLFSGNQVTFNLTDAGLNANQTYDLLSFVDGGFTSGVLGASDWLLGATPGGFDAMTLSVTDTLIQLQTGNLVSGTFYWRGLTDTTWNANFNNWSTDKAGTIAATTLPGQDIDVVFAYNGASGALVTNLEQNFRIKSLTFESGTTTPTSVTIDPGSADPNSRIEVAPAASTNGIKITTGGPAAATISGRLRLGADQTWDVADSGSVLSLGSLAGEADVTVSGAGKIILTSASDPTFNSGVTSDFSISGATLEIQNAAALGSTINSNLATVSVGSGAAFYYKGAANSAATGVANPLTLAGGTLSAGGSTGNYYYTGTVNVSADSFINMRDSNAAAPGTTQSNVVLSGAVSGTGKLTVDSIGTVTGGNQYTGTLYFQNDNSGWSGGIDLLRGTIQTQTTTGLGTGNITASAGRIQFVTAGGTTHTLNQNITVDASGGILELSADASGTPVSDMTVNLNGTITIGSASNANNALRFSQASDNFSVFNIGGPIVLGNDASITYQGSSVRPLIISTVISDGGSGYDLAINDELGGWTVTSQTVRLTGANTFSGDISLTEGTLEFDTVTNAGGAASSLGQGNAITLAGATLSFIGGASQSTDRPITNNAGSPTLSANGIGGATITYTGAIAQAANLSLTLTGTGTGIISGGITQTAGSADLVVNSGTWTIDTNNVTVTDDLLVNGGTLTLQNMAFGLADDMVITGSSTILNLNSAGVWAPTTPAGTSSFIYARGGAVVNLNANDVNGTANANGTEGFLLGDGTTAGTGTLNTNGYNITIPRLDLGSINPLYDGAVTGSGTITATYTGTDYAQGFRFFKGSVAANLAGGSPILKQGLGDVTLSGNNSGLTGSVAAATRLDAGNLILDYTTSNTTKLPANQALDMRGSTVTVNGNNAAATSQTVASFTLGSGGSNGIDVNAGAGQTAVLNLGAITRANGSQDGTIRFYLPTGTQSATNGVTTTSPNSTFGLLGTGASSSADAAYATVDDGTGVWFATGVSNGTNNNIVALASTVKDNVTTWAAGDHVTDSTGFTGGSLTCTNINSLRFDAAAGSDLTVAAGSTLNVASGGILVTSNVGGTPSITGGTLVSATQEIVVHQDSTQPFEIGSAIRGAYAVTKTGAGALLLSGNNYYTDETEIQEGTLRVGGGNAIGDTSLVTLADDRASTLELLSSETIGRLQGGSATTGLNTLALVDIGAHTLTVNQTANTTYAGLLTGTGNLVKQGTGNLAVTNASSGFTGILTVDNGLVYLAGIGQINASIIRINKGGTFLIDNNGTTRSGTRILDTTPITMNSADGVFSGETVVRGLAIRSDNDDTLDEAVGVVTAASGANYVGMTTSGANDDTDIIVNDLVRLNNATINIRGTAMGGTTARENEFRIGDADNRTNFVATMIGGGGAGGSTNISIIPWAIGETVAAALGSTNMGNSLLTYANSPHTGMRALDFATEYTTIAAATATDNARESLAANLTGLAGTTVNALVLHNASASAATFNVAGTGAGQTLGVTSGTLLFTRDTAGAGAYGINLGGFDSGITVGGTNEYIFFVVDPDAATASKTLTATISSPLTSSADITKSGRGALILSGSNTAGGGSNKTTLNEGILEIADLDNIGGNSGALVFAGGILRLGATLTDDISLRTIAFLDGGATIDTNGLAYTLANTVGSGIGGLTKTGAGTLTLNAAATYTGPTIVSTGTLTAGASNATGNGGDLTILGGATFDVGTSSVTHRLVTLSGADPVINGTGTITAATGFFFDHDGGSDLVTVGAVLAGPGGLLKANRASNLTLAGLNTFTGPLEVQQGTLSFDSIANVGGGASALGNPATVEDGIIRMGLTTTATTLTYTGSGHSTDRIIAMQGTTGGVTINSNGTGALNLGTIKGANAGTKTLTLSGTSDVSIDNTAALINECVATLNLTKSGTNTWLLTGVNTYSGVTNVDNGTLKIGVADSLPTTTAVRIGTGSTAGTLDLNGYDQTIGSLTSQSTTNAVTNNIIVDTGNTLTINGAVTLGANADNSSTAVTATGGGAILVNSGGANFQVGGATGATNDNKATVDFTGLSSFTANLGTGTFRLGDGNTGTENNTSTFKLATNNAITAASIRIGDGSGGTYTHTLTLGSGTNALNADTINVGSAGATIRSGGAIVFDPGDTTGTVTLRASDGASRATLNMINTTGNTAGAMSSTIDFTGHNADILVSTLTMANRTVGTGGATATLSFDQGTLDVTTLNMASRTGTGTGGADATLNIGGGTATIGAVNMAVSTDSGGAVTADMNVTGGAVTLGPINMANAGASRTVTSTIDLTGGTVDVTGTIIRTGGAGTENATVTLNGSVLDMNGFSIGSAAQNITLAAESGTLENLGELNGGGALTKTTTGTLTLGGTNTYTGNTVINGGTLLVDGTTAAASAFTINGDGSGNPETLGGTGTIGGSVTATGGGTLLTAGTAAATGTLGSIGTLTVNGNVSATGSGNVWLVNLARFNGGDTGGGTNADLLTLGGSAQFQTLNNFTLQIDDTGTDQIGDIYKFASFTSTTGWDGSLFNGGALVDGGLITGANGGIFTIDYDNTAGAFYLVSAIPEPSAFLPLALLLIAGLLPRRRR